MSNDAKVLQRSVAHILTSLIGGPILRLAAAEWAVHQAPNQPQIKPFQRVSPEAERHVREIARCASSE
jgi:hypothetical protein